MSNVRKIIKNIVVLGVSQVLNSVLSFFLLIYVARYLGEHDFGKYSFAISFTSLFVIFANFGINNLIIREIARNKQLTKCYLINSVLIKFILSILTLGLIIIIINSMDYSQDTKQLVYIFGIYAILTSFVILFKSALQAHEMMEYVSIIVILDKMVLLAVVLLALFYGYGLIELAYVYVFSGIFSVLLSAALVLINLMPMMKKPIIDKGSIQLSIWKTLIAKSTPFGLNDFLASMFFQIDTIMLSILRDNQTTGIYNAAYNPLLALNIIPIVYINAIYPVMSRLFMNSTNSLDKLLKLSIKYIAIIAFPVAIGCFILADRFIELFYVEQFSASVNAFMILSFFIPLRWISSITGTFLTSTDRQNFRTFGVGLSALFNVILNLILIPKLGYIGASISTVVSEILLYLVFLYFVNTYHDTSTFHKYYIKPFIASTFMGLILFIFQYSPLYMLIPVACVFYFVILLILNTFTEDDKQMIIILFSNRMK